MCGGQKTEKQSGGNDRSGKTNDKTLGDRTPKPDQHSNHHENQRIHIHTKSQERNTEHQGTESKTTKTGASGKQHSRQK